MLTQLRRSAVMVLICLVLFGLVFPLVGVGVSQLFFKHQADGSITANGSTLIGQNWADAPCPGHPLGSCVFHGRPDDTGPYGASKTASGGDNPLEACQGKTCYSGESAATNYGPRSKLLLNATLQ